MADDHSAISEIIRRGGGVPVFTGAPPLNLGAQRPGTGNSSASEVAPSRDLNKTPPSFDRTDDPSNNAELAEKLTRVARMKAALLRAHDCFEQSNLAYGDAGHAYRAAFEELRAAIADFSHDEQESLLAEIDAKLKTL